MLFQNLSKGSKLGSGVEETRPSNPLSHELSSQNFQPRTLSSLGPKDASSHASHECLSVAAPDTAEMCPPKTTQSDPFRLRTRCYSIDLGVLHGFTRQFLLSNSELGVRFTPTLEQLNINQDVSSIHRDKSSQTETFVRRRRRRTRTECSDQQYNARTSEIDNLPALWERSSRNSVAQPFSISRLTVKQPLSDIDRYSMIEGQIS